ncbi:MAG: EamA family transporter [Rickettsiales bacterium]
MSPFHIVLAILVAALWGGNFVAAKITLQTLPPLTLLAVRFIITAILLWPFAPKPTVPLKQIFLLSTLLGVTHFSLMFAAIYWGVALPNAVIATQLGVPFSCLLGTIFFKDMIGRWRALGMLVAFVGIVIIVGTPSIANQFWPFMVSCLAAFAWAVANIQMKRIGQVHIMALLSRLSLFAFPQLALLSMIFEHGQIEAIQSASTQVWLGMAYTVLFSTIVAYGMWYYLLGRFPVSQVTPYSLLVPVFGILASQWFFHTPLTTQFLIGGAFTMAGVAIIIFRRPQEGILEK